ncbi:hypothetical protein DFA_03174 [Cavenderia fasciculata]|uniref:Uncharacterized protein n=1 Tax=Cavenderia fasciculata TaxID=261658 RepID=F4PGU5_CACFS|nr:uncharacterized protein DFA_03174 [Cavenderia fasciculata]EGG24929.1 hypothetical protein DFA_03174 [Cavenderia fasciculata]|eukprot:XP_004362780.1 hypothetical protein DFA_03174 [Cavenderia fasciculata]
MNHSFNPFMINPFMQVPMMNTMMGAPPMQMQQPPTTPQHHSHLHHPGTPSTPGNSNNANTVHQTEGPGLMQHQKEKYGAHLFQKNDDGSYTCFFAGCGKQLSANFSRHISRHEQDGDPLDPSVEIRGTYVASPPKTPTHHGHGSSTPGAHMATPNGMWWLTSPVLPQTEFYNRASKCKKCYIRQQQDSKRNRLNQGSTSLSHIMSAASHHSNSMDDHPTPTKSIYKTSKFTTSFDSNQTTTTYITFGDPTTRVDTTSTTHVEATAVAPTTHCPPVDCGKRITHVGACTTDGQQAAILASQARADPRRTQQHCVGQVSRDYGHTAQGSTFQAVP